MDTISNFHPDANPDPDSSFQIKAQTLEKGGQMAHIPYNLACPLDADPVPVPDPAYDLDPDPDP